MSATYINSNSEFYNTYCLFREYINFSEDYTYRQWVRLPERFKAAALYCQFYDEITLAWYKVKTAWSIEEEGVETIVQYLMKNVQKIEEDGKRFKPQYIYKVAYNCLYCLCIDPSKNKDRYYKETSETFEVGDDDLSWFDLIGESFDIDEEKEKDRIRDLFDSFDEDLQMYIDFVLGNLTEVMLCRYLKREGKIDGNTKDAKYRSKVVDEFSEYARDKIKLTVSVEL